MKRLYVSDLDGTLFSNFNGFDPVAKAWLRRLIQDEGVHFTFATARVVPSALQALGHPPMSLPMIGCGGAVLLHPDGRILHECLLEPSLVREAVSLFQWQKLGMTVILSPRGARAHERRWWAPDGFRLMDSFIASHWNDEGFMPLGEAGEVDGLPCVGLSCCGAWEAVCRVRSWASGHLGLRFEMVEDPYQKGVFVGFLQDDRASKGETLEKLCAYLGLSLAKVTVFGDALNDLSMFSLQPCRKVAVDCAVREIKELADIVLAADDSVLAFIERELKV